MYKLPCLWDEKHIYIFSSTLRGKSTRVTLFALFSHPFGSMSKGIVFIDKFIQILGCFIVLPINVFEDSVIVANNILYLTSHSFILGILDIMYYIIYGVWNYVASFHNNNFYSITFSCSFCWIVTWYNCLCKLQITMRFMFVTNFTILLWKKVCHIFKSL